MKKTVKALYGSVAMQKGYCERCKGYSFIFDSNTVAYQMPSLFNFKKRRDR